mgnify:CR=1 FL=1
MVAREYVTMGFIRNVPQMYSNGEYLIIQNIKEWMYFIYFNTKWHLNFICNKWRGKIVPTKQWSLRFPISMDLQEMTSIYLWVKMLSYSHGVSFLQSKPTLNLLTEHELTKKSFFHRLANSSISHAENVIYILFFPRRSLVITFILVCGPGFLLLISFFWYWNRTYNRWIFIKFYYPFYCLRILFLCCIVLRL